MFKGARVTVQTVLDWMAKGRTMRQIQRRWPSLKRKPIAEAVQLASKALVEQSGSRPLVTPETVEEVLDHQRQWKRIKPKMSIKPIGSFLVVHPNVCFGKLTFDGTRVPVETVLYFMSTGYSIERILKNWPYLERGAIVEAIRLAAAALTYGYATPARGIA